MPSFQANSSSRKRLTAIVRLLLIAAVLLLVFFKHRQQQQYATAKPESKVSSDALEPKPQASFSSPLSSSHFPTSSDTPAVIAALIRDWEDLDVPEQRDAHFAELESLLQTTDLAALVSSLPVDVLDFALGLPTFQAWIKSNPDIALALLASRSPVSESRIRPALAAWFEKDPVACSQYLRALPLGPWREQTIALSSQLAEASDPANAASWAALLAPGPLQTGLLEEIASVWSARNPSKAAAWISSFSDARLRERLHAVHALAFAESDPARAAAWLLQTVRPGDLRDQTMARLASIWAATDPTMICAWLDRLPDSEARQAALGTVINAWSLHDRPAAQAWIFRLPAGPMRDEAQAHFESLPVLKPAN